MIISKSPFVRELATARLFQHLPTHRYFEPQDVSIGIFTPTDKVHPNLFAEAPTFLSLEKVPKVTVITSEDDFNGRTEHVDNIQCPGLKPFTKPFVGLLTNYPQGYYDYYDVVETPQGIYVDYNFREDLKYLDRVNNYKPKPTDSADDICWGLAKYCSREGVSWKVASLSDPVGVSFEATCSREYPLYQIPGWKPQILYSTREKKFVAGNWNLRNDNSYYTIYAVQSPRVIVCFEGVLPEAFDFREEQR